MTSEAVALRWLIDQGTFPVVTTRWAPRGAWRQFGYEGWWPVERRGRPGVDKELFGVGSFLDARDVAAIDALAGF